MENFVHLHTHTEYSLLDGAARIEKLVKKAAELGMTALAITDHGVMYGVIDFYKACKKVGIKPIIGCEVYVAPNKRTEKISGRDDSNRHLVLLAENETGYRNLIQLVSIAYIEGFYYKPRIDKDILAKHSEGLIALSACLAGEVAEYLHNEQLEMACKAAKEYEEIFGKGNFFLELQDHGMEEQRKVNRGIWKVHELTGIPIVATNDVHYVTREDAFVQDILLCIQTGKTLADSKRMSFSSQDMYLKSRYEMDLIFGETPEVLENACLIAERCKLDFTFGNNHLPMFEVPDGLSLDEYLRQKCEEAFLYFYPEASNYERDRLDFELQVISKTGFSGYFLIVADFCQYARKNGVAVGPGRGSAAASMVAYLLGITAVDPLRHELLFERFLNPERISMPDIDIDFDPDGREKVIRYVTEKYGADKVCQIITFGTMGAKAAIRDVGRVLGIPLGKVDKVAKAIPSDLGMTLDKALTVSPDLIKLMEDEDVKRLYELAQAVEGMPRHASTHAAGVVIAKQPLATYLPLQKLPDGFLMTQFPMKTVEEIGLLKMDFLGLRNLTILSETIKLVKETVGISIDLNSISLEDISTYQLLSKGNSTGVFQLESGGMRAILKELRPSCFEDIIAVLALYRPGPMEQIPEFIKRKHGGSISYLHPKLEPILKSTYGIIVYQEQVMQIARDLAGYSLGRADLLRRAMGKKKKEIMEEERQSFIYGLEAENGDLIIPGALRCGLNKKEAEEIFDLMAKFAEYGFNKGHATAYAVISYQTAYLKANYPLQFTAALISTVMGSSEKTSYYVQEARSSGIKILPPDVQFSKTDFTIEKDSIRFGLGAIRNVGANVVEKILEARAKGIFTSFYDFCLRVENKVLNKRVLESLIKAGAFQSLCKRSQALEVLDKVLELAQRRQKDRDSGQISLFDVEDNLDDGLVMPNLPELGEREILNLEKEYLGLYLTGHPLSAVNSSLRKYISSNIINCLEGNEDQKVILGGLVTSYRQTITKKGEMMASFALEDLTGSIEVLIFPRLYAQISNLADDQIIVVDGKYNVRDDEKKIFAEKIKLLEDILESKQSNNQLDQPVDFSSNFPKGQMKVPESSRTLKTKDRLYLRLKHESEDRMDKVVSTLRKYPGKYPVYFYFLEQKKLLEGRKDLWVDNQTDLNKTLIQILGEENVAWKQVENS